MTCKPVEALRTLMTEEKVNTAFNQIKDNHDLSVEGCYLERIRESRYGDMVKFLGDFYFPDEPIRRSLNVQLDQSMQEILLKSLQQNLSIAMVSTDTGEIIAGQIITIDNKHECFDKRECISEDLAIALGVAKHFENVFNIYDFYNVKEVIHLWQLAVHKQHRRKGIGRKIIKAIQELYKSVDIGPKVIRVEGSSNFSKRIFENLEFSKIAEIIFADYKHNGKNVLESTGEHESIIMYGMVV